MVEPLILHLDIDKAVFVRNALMFFRQSCQLSCQEVQEILDAIDNYLISHLGRSDI